VKEATPGKYQYETNLVYVNNNKLDCRPRNFTRDGKCSIKWKILTLSRVLKGHSNAKYRYILTQRDKIWKTNIGNNNKIHKSTAMDAYFTFSPSILF
jgi:hypothetical protein